jgi:ParB family chromosome partitioning protein
MTQQTILYVPARDCYKSPDNVRTISDPTADAELEANIGATGAVIQNLIGLASKRKKGQYEIYGGGRRLERVHANIAKGTLGEDFMVPVYPARNKLEAISMSLAENYFNLRMNPADECRGFKAVIDIEKKTPVDVAKRFGVSEKFVLGRMRLANLADPVFEALRSGEITLDIAKAYASTADTDAQAKVFEHMANSYHRGNANEIRRLLATGSFKGADPKAILVGRDAYLAAGGRLETDLFSDHGTEIWLDGDIVERLAEQALVAAARAIRNREGFAEVRPVVSTSIPYSETFQLRQIEPEPIALLPDADARCAEIDTELAEIARVADNAGGYSPEQEARIEALEEELGSIVSGDVALTEAQKAGAIAYVLIGRDGSPQLYHEYYAVQPEGDDPAQAWGETKREAVAETNEGDDEHPDDER